MASQSPAGDFQISIPQGMFCFPQGIFHPTGSAVSYKECSIPQGIFCVPQGMFHPTGRAVAVSLSGLILGVPTLLSPPCCPPAVQPYPKRSLKCCSILELVLSPRGCSCTSLASPGQIFPEDFVSHMGMNHTGDSHADPRAWDNQSHLFKGRFPAQPSGKEFD